MTPLVSVIIPTYNNSQYILDAVESVLNQTVSDYEVIIVDDCSTDNTREILSSLLKEHSNIHYFCLDQNSGPAIARTEAIKLSRGKYCAFLDADDMWDDIKLEHQLGFMEENNAKFCCTGYRLIDESGKSLNMIRVPPKYTNYQKCIRLSDPIGNLTVIYDQEALGKFAVPQIRKRNDFALWLQVLKKTEYCYGLSEILGSYRCGRNSSVSSNKFSLVKYHWQLYHCIEKRSGIQSVFDIICWMWAKGIKGDALKKGL